MNRQQIYSNRGILAEQAVFAWLSLTLGTIIFTLLSIVLSVFLENREQIVIISFIFVMPLIVIANISIHRKHYSTDDIKNRVYNEWRKVGLRKADQQEATSQLAKVLVYLVFPKDIKIFDAAASLFFNRASIEPLLQWDPQGVWEWVVLVV